MHDVMFDLVVSACKNLKFICKHIVAFFVEDHATDRIDYDNLLEYLMYIPAGTSARNVNHWIQFYSTKEFNYFDFGPEMNMIKYNQANPPKYDLTKFKNYTIPSLMTISDSDPFSKEDDCNHLFEHIQPSVVKIKKLKSYNHLDYLWSSHAKEDIYYDILNFLQSNDN